jgi:aldose 1-epimerase
MSQRYSVNRETREGVEVFALRGADGAVAEVAPSLGNNCFAFSAGGAPVLEEVPFATFSARPTSYGIPVLFPFPNRVRDGRFTFGGERYEVDPPRHGFVRDKPWRVEEAGATEEAGAWLTSSFDAADYPELTPARFPSSFRLEVTYRLEGGRLSMETEARNTGARAMPLGFGIHPYFRLPARGEVSVPARRRWELAESLPTGRLLGVEGAYDLRGGRSLEGLSLDDIYTGVEPDGDGRARCAVSDLERGTRTVVEFDASEFPHVVVYTPPAPRRAVCVEPNTCPTDAFNLHARGVESNVITLGAGESATFTISLYVESLRP